MDTEILLREMEALKVGPDEVLILRFVSGDLPDGLIEGLSKALEEVGLKGRSLIIFSDDEIEFATVARSEVDAP